MIFENLKLGYFYQDFYHFKESEVTNIINLIGPSRVGKYIKFKCYGNASFNEEDQKHEFVTIKELDNFERKNSNVIVFEVTDENCKNVFTELFLYHNVTIAQSSYGLISYNNKTRNISHKIQIGYDPYDLMIAFNKSTLHMQQPNPFSK